MLSILVAYTKEGRIIGSDGRIPWNLPSERLRFKEICAGRRVIMGHKTFAEIGKALSYCTIVIVSKSMAPSAVPDGCLLAKDFAQAVEMCQDQEVLVAGGEEIYRQALALPQTTKIYATEIDADFEGDRIFPPLSDFAGGEAVWSKKTESRHQDKDSGIEYEYVTYEKLTLQR
jgi:dihydrofolate reductase